MVELIGYRFSAFQQVARAHLFRLFIAVALLLLDGNTLQAQDSTSRRAIFSRFQLGLSITPDISYRLLRNVNGSMPGDSIRHWRDSTERPQWGYAAGLNLQYRLHPKWSLEIGVQYRNTGHSTQFSSDWRPQTTGDPLLPEKLKWRYDFYTWDVPLQINYRQGKGAWQFYSGLGLITHYFIHETQTMIAVYPNETKVSTTETAFRYRQLSFSVMLNAGAEFKLGKRCTLRLAPQVRYGIRAVNAQPLRTHYYGVGINAGIYFQL